MAYGRLNELALRNFSFDGTLEMISAPRATARVAASASFNRWDPTTLEVRLILPDDSKSVVHEIVRIAGPNDVQIVPVDTDLPVLRLQGVHGCSLSEHHGNIEARGIVIGLSADELPVDTSVNSMVQLQPSGILAPHAGVELHYTGEIKVEPWDEMSCTVQTKYGPIEVRQTFQFGDDELHGDRITLRVQRVTLMGDLVCPAGQSMAAMHEQLAKDHKDICIVLSLASRLVVDWYETAYHYPIQNSYREALVRRRWIEPKVLHDTKPLIDQRHLVCGGLQTLIENYRSAREARAIEKSIAFLAASYGAPLESAYFLAFSAMEAAVNAALPDERRLVVGKSLWRKIEKLMSASLKCIGTKLSLEDTTVASMREKLPELKRPALSTRVTSVCALHSIRTDDLWRDRTLEDGIIRVSAVRNDLFHAANTTSDDLYADLLRVQTLCERVILALLKWPRSSCFELCDDTLHHICR